MQNLTYTSRGLRRRRNSDRWEAVLSHTDPVTGEVVRTFHTVEGKTRRQAERARDALILDLERKGGAVDSSMSVRHDVVAVAITGDRQANLRHLRSLPLVRGLERKCKPLTTRKGPLGENPQRPLFLIATAAAEPSCGRPPRRQEHLTTAGRETMTQVDNLPELSLKSFPARRPLWQTLR